MRDSINIKDRLLPPLLLGNGNACNESLNGWQRDPANLMDNLEGEEPLESPIESTDKWLVFLHLWSANMRVSTTALVIIVIITGQLVGGPNKSINKKRQCSLKLFAVHQHLHHLSKVTNV